MNATQIRYRNARKLLAEVGTLEEFAVKIDRKASQVGQFLGKSPSRGIGHNIARLIEEKFGKEDGWMDTYHSDSDSLDEDMITWLESLDHDQLSKVAYYIEGRLVS